MPYTWTWTWLLLHADPVFTPLAGLQVLLSPHTLRFRPSFDPMMAVSLHP